MPVPDESQQFSQDERSLLLEIARESVTVYVTAHEILELHPEDIPESFSEVRGVFVTLRDQGKLRGCIGVTQPKDNLAETVRHSAIQSATRDPRFDAVTPDELGGLHFEISVLGLGAQPGSPFIPIGGPEDILIGRDGIYLEIPGGRGGLLLPQVASEREWDSIAFLDALAVKAGLPTETWRDPTTKLYRFTAEVFEEGEPSGGSVRSV